MGLINSKASLTHPHSQKAFFSELSKKSEIKNKYQKSSSQIEFSFA
jgi:hypothetical protein